VTDLEVQQTSSAVIAGIRSPEFADQLAAALPPGLTPDRFQRLTVTALLDDQIKQRDPAKQLLACDRASLFQAIIKSAQDGLTPDGREAALVKRGDKVVYQPMVAGLRKIAARYGWTIRSAAVREKDEFDYTDEPPSLYHKVFTSGARGELVFAYAVARHEDGRREQRVMTRDDVLKRAESATTKQVWDAWPDEMWAKTPARDLFQELPFAVAYRAVERIEAEDAVFEPVPQSEIEGSAGADGIVSPPETQPTAEPAAADPPSAAAGNDDPEPEPTPADGGEATPEALQQLAAAAALYVPPNGKYAEKGDHGPKTLAEIAEMGDDGKRWFEWALPRVSDPPEYAAALWSYARIFLPKQYQEAVAKKDLS
jgi:recombination protein RecT